MGRNSSRPADGRLNLYMQRYRLRVDLTRQVAELASEVGESMPGRHKQSAGGDPERLRGIPVAGRGISGTWNHSNPESGIARADRARWLARQSFEVQALGVLAEGVDPTSPGTQPEDALIAKEEAAESQAASSE